MRLKGTALLIEPVNGPLSGSLTLPGSKSITNRALLLAGLAFGTSRLTGALKSDDTKYMANALRQMGVGIDEPDDSTFVVRANGRLAAPADPLFLGNAGTATRFLVAAAANIEGTTKIDGDANMRKRPISPLMAALAQLGVEISAPTGCPPVTVRGPSRSTGSRVVVDAGLSSQYVSALLMAASTFDRRIEIELAGSRIGARGYIDLTVSAIRAFGGEVFEAENKRWIVEPRKYRATSFPIEPDASAATYIWAAEALTRGSIDIGISADKFTQPDAAAHRLISQFPGLPAVIDGSQIQDAVPTLAVLAAFNRNPVRFTGIGNLRVKECDRIAALSTELNRIHAGLASQEGNDLIVHSDPSLSEQNPSTEIETYEDHRIAMAFSLAGLRLEGITILDPGCVAKTYPGYWDALSSLGVRLREADRKS